MEGLGERLEAATRAMMGDLLRLHGLDGGSAPKIEEEMKDFSMQGQKELSVRKGAIWGGLASGALSGLAADLATGGLSFGGGAVLGALLGALGGAGLAKGFARVGGLGDPAVSWSEDALARLVRDAVARYLAVAHFGRGRGGFQDVDLPADWAVRIHEALIPHANALDAAFKMGTRQGRRPSRRSARRRPARLLDATRRLLAGLTLPPPPPRSTGRQDRVKVGQDGGPPVSQPARTLAWRRGHVLGFCARRLPRAGGSADDHGTEARCGDARDLVGSSKRRCSAAVLARLRHPVHGDLHRVRPHGADHGLRDRRSRAVI
jgi:hypothetical protein